MYTVAFILALLAFGGLAAYLGDLLGYRLGKRRLSLLRLRPRTTARLVGIVVGMLIPGVTVGVTSLLFDEVRDAVFRLDDLHREIGSLQAERDTMAQQRDGLVRQATQSRKAAQQAGLAAQETRRDLATVTRDLQQARGRLTEARTRVSQLREQAARLGRERDGAVRDRDAARKSLGEADILLTDAEKALEEAERGLDEALKRVQEAEAEEQRLTRGIDRLQKQLAQVREDWEVQHKLFSLRRPVLEIDTELVRGVVARPDTVERLTDEIVALLVLADTVAEAAGAGPTEKGRFTRAVYPVAEGREWGEDELPAEEMIIGEVRRQLWGSEAGETVVQVKAALRTFAGEPALVRFEARPNELVFTAGETIVARPLDAGLTEAEAFEELWRIIADPQSSEVRRQARDAGLLPDPQTGGYGEITIRELYAAAHECSGRAETTRVRIQAAEDAYTLGPLKIRILVEPSGGE